MWVNYFDKLKSKGGEINHKHCQFIQNGLWNGFMLHI